MKIFIYFCTKIIFINLNISIMRTFIAILIVLFSINYSTQAQELELSNTTDIALYGYVEVNGQPGANLMIKIYSSDLSIIHHTMYTNEYGQYAVMLYGCPAADWLFIAVVASDGRVLQIECLDIPFSYVGDGHITRYVNFSLTITDITCLSPTDDDTPNLLAILQERKKYIVAK